MQELRRGRRRLLIKAKDKEHWLRQIYDKHLGNPAPKIGSTHQPCTYLPFMIYTLLLQFTILFIIYDKHFGNMAPKIGSTYRTTLALNRLLTDIL